MTGWAIEALAASTLLMLVVLALRGPVARRFGAHAAYLLWLLPALRMILPRLPHSMEPVRTVPIHLDIDKLVAAGATPGVPAVPAFPALPQTAISSVDWLTIGLIMWLAGAALYLAWQLGRHHRFMSIALEHAGTGFLRSGIRVQLSSVVSGPLAAGIFHRHILLPEDFEQRYTGNEQQLALAHELAHHRRGDLIANSFALAMLALHWFNPIAHWAYRAFRVDQELACDATVLGAAPESRSDYGRALIKSAQAGMPGSAACALGPATELKRRITMIAHSTRSRARRIAGASLAAILVAAGLGLTASGSIAAPSAVAPTSVKPLLEPEARPQVQPQAKGVMVSDHGKSTVMRTVQYADNDTALPPLPVSPVPPLPPQPSVAMVPPVPPVPPVPALPAPLSAEQARQLQQAAREAGEAARLAVANIDFAKVSREAMTQARAELERQCTHAKPAPANESDAQAISRLSLGCVDMAEIGRQVQDALRQATEEIRNDRNIPDADRARALAQIDKTKAEMARKFAQ